MGKVVAAQDLYMNAKQDTCVTFKSGEAAFLLAKKGRHIPASHTEFVTKKGNPKQAKPAKTKEVAAAENKGSD